MTGLDKIIEKIRFDSDAQCNKIFDDARQQAVDILNNAEIKGREAYDRIVEEAERQAENETRLAKSSVQMNAGRTVLTAKNEAVHYALQAVLKAMRGMPVKEYFAFLAKLAIKNAQDGAGVLFLNADDLKRMPKGFESALEKRLPKDRAITVSKEAKAISDGFILAYGDIEINCTFEAMLEAGSEEIRDIICKIIF